MSRCIIQNVILLAWLECVYMETSAPLFNVIVNNAPFHSNSHINQILPQIIPILRFFSDGVVDPDFVINCNELGAVQKYQKSRSSYGSLTLLHFRTGGSG